MKYIIAFTLFLIFFTVAYFSYFAVIKFSAEQTMPGFIWEYTRSSGDTLNLYYWSFIFVTFNLPYALIAWVCGMIARQFSFWWLAAVAFCGCLLNFQALSHGPAHWWSVFIATLLASVAGAATLSLLKHRYR